MSASTNHFHWNGDVFNDGQLIDTITPRHGSTKTESKRRRREPVWDPEEYPGHWRAVWLPLHQGALPIRPVRGAIMDRIVHNSIWIDTGSQNMREHAAMTQ